MTQDIFRTLIVPDAQVALARAIAAALAPGGAGMWTTPLSPTGTAPATHWASSGLIPPGWQQMVPTQVWAENADGQWVKVSETPGDPALVLHAALAAGIETDADAIAALFASADVTEQDPYEACARLGLTLVNPPGAL